MVAASAGSVAATPGWNEFEWVHVHTDSMNIDRAAILMPVDIAGARCKMQLDTALGNSVLYRPGLPGKYRLKKNTSTITINDFQFAGKTWPRTFDLTYPGVAAKQRQDCGVPEMQGNIGSMGSDLFLKGSLSLDLLHGKFAYADGPYSEKPEQAARKIALSLEDLGSGEVPVISINVGALGIQKFLLDTGSSSENMAVFDKASWLKIVGLSDMKQATASVGPRWGKQITCYSAPAAQSLGLAGVSKEVAILVKYCDDERGWQGHDKLMGILGLAFFKNDIITIDYVSRQLIVEPAGMAK